MSDKKIVCLKGEGLLKSILSDLFTVGILTAALTVSHFLVGSKSLDAVLIVMLFFFFCALGTSRKETFYSVADLVDHLCEEYPDQIHISSDKKDS